MTQHYRKDGQPSTHEEADTLDLQALLESSREAIARAAAEVLAERDATALLATKHTSHSSHSSSSTW